MKKLTQFTLFSAGINVFVPSGGTMVCSRADCFANCSRNEIPVAKSIMALAYGDQLTNMLQPFWALPLLGITGLKAKDILPYTLILMFVGLVIFSFGLLVF